MNHTRKCNRVQMIILLLLGIVMILCAGYLLNIFVVQPAQIQEDIRELKSIRAEPVPVNSQTTHTNAKPNVQKKTQISSFERMQKVHRDIKGWLTVPGTNIDYPVLQSSKSQPDYYLHRNYKKHYREAGSLYLQYDCKPQISRNSVIYGHHMLYDAMFTELTKYNYFSFWKTHQSFFYEDISGKHSYEIFAVLHVSPDHFQFNRTQFADDTDYARFLSALQSRSIYKTGMSVTAKDKIMMLVTCSYEQRNGRTVVIGKLIKGGQN